MQTLSDNEIVKMRLANGLHSMLCSLCEIRILLLDNEERLVAIHAPLVSTTSRTEHIAEMDRAADSGVKREANLLTVQGKEATEDFDVFLCHHGVDKPDVKKIGEQLKQQGILPWLDEWQLRPGLPWQSLLEQQITKIKSAAVFIGEDGVGSWEQMELWAFLSEFVKRRCPVIPVILSKAQKSPQLPIFLREMTWVDFRKQSPDPMERLIWGITGKKSIAMSAHASPPPTNPDIKRELKQQLLSLSPRSFEFFASDFLVYVGLEAISVTRYIGDGGIDAQGDLIAGGFRIPVGIQVKRHRNNVQRPDIDRFIGALSGRFSEGMFMTTADYAPSALQKAATSIPRVLTLNGEQVVSIMVEHSLGLKASSLNAQKLDIDPDYFAAFEAMRNLLVSRVREGPQNYNANTSVPDPGASSDEQTIELRPEEDLISLNALGYALRVDPTRVRRWIENGTLQLGCCSGIG